MVETCHLFGTKGRHDENTDVIFNRSHKTQMEFAQPVLKADSVYPKDQSWLLAFKNNLIPDDKHCREN